MQDAAKTTGGAMIGPAHTIAQTYLGNGFDLLRPAVGDVAIVDIAWQLARQSRFNGATAVGPPYSVAQHSVLVSMLTPPDVALAALLHDAAEAYTGDIARPVKNALGEGVIDAIERPIARVIFERFDVPWHHYDGPHIHKAADLVALATERRDLMAISSVTWVDLPTPHPDAIIAWPWHVAQREFLYRFAELCPRFAADG